MEINSTFLNNQQVTEEVKREIKKFLETNDKKKGNKWQNLWDAAKAVLRGRFIQYSPTQETRALNRQPHFTPKTAGKEE